ncbi:MAG TPA: extracellular solute-binding protein [Chloroflexota bacterium]|nr:extracellular solute-binding protein [Chloroflexota bacterium]
MLQRLVSRRQVVLSATAAGSGLALAACGAPGVQEPAGGVSSAPLTLLWAVRGGGTPEMRDRLLAEYKTVRPNVTVEQFDASGGIAPSIEKIAAGLAAGLNIDFINGHLASRQLIESIDAVQAIDDLVRRDKFDLGRYNKDALESTGRYDSKLYTVPYAYGGDVAAVGYNKSLFRQAGVPEPSADWSKPWTWEEFREAMRRLTKPDGSQVGLASIGFWLHTFPMQWNARWLTNDYRTITSDSPAMMDAMTKLTDLIFKDRVTGITPGVTSGSGDNAFFQGKAAVALPCCYASRFARSTKGTGVELGFITFPKGTVSTLDVSPVVMGIAKVTKQRNEAWDFMKFMDDKSRLAAAEERIPAVLPDMLPWVKQNFAEFPDSKAEMIVEGMRVAKPLEPLRYHPQWQKIDAEVLAPAWKEVMEQKRTGTDMLKAVKPLLQNIVDEHARSRRK